MDRRQAILQWTEQLERAGAQADWDALGALSAVLAKHVPTLAALGPWTDPERAALLQLRSAHAQACQICTNEKERLGCYLGDLQENREGRLAYALIGETDPDGNQV